METNTKSRVPTIRPVGPVAAFIPGQGYVKTETYHSNTTSRHVNKWTENRATKLTQDGFEAEIGALFV